MKNMDEPLDGSDAESSYSGISNEDFEEPDEDVEDPDEENQSAVDEEPVSSDAEGVLSTADAGDLLSEEDGSEVLSAADAAEVLSASDAEDAMSVSDAGEVLPASGDDGFYPESDVEDVMSVSDADFVPSDEVESGENQADGAGADRSLAPSIKEEPVSASNDDRSPSLHLKEESMSISDVEPPADNTSDKDVEDVSVKEEPLASDSEVVLSTSRGTSGVSEKGNLRGNEGARKHGKQNRSYKCADEVRTTELSGYGTRPLGRKLVQKPKPRTENAQFVLPAPYLGPRELCRMLFHCYFCDFSNRYKCRLTTHMAKHYPPTRLCHLCGKGFCSLSNLKQHLMFHADHRPYKCRLCDYAGQNLRRIKQHLAGPHLKSLTTEDASQYYDVDSVEREAFLSGCRLKPKWENKAKAKKKSNENPFKCDFKAQNRESLRAHIKRHTQKRTFSCFHCGWTSDKKFCLANHIKARHVTERFNCLLCGYSSNYRKALKSHYVARHTSEKACACPLCKQNVPWSILKGHMETHSDENSECRLCSMPMTEIDSFSDHMMVNHVDAQFVGNGKSSGKSKVYGKSYSCLLCKRQCATLRGFVEHMAAHSREKNLKCPHCPFSTDKTPVLNEHVNGRHTKKTRYPCSFCDYEALYKSNLNAHVNAKHTQKRRLKCRFCPFQSLYWGSMKCHEIRHVNDKEYACDLCDFKTNRSGYMRTHKLTHSKERPFMCDLCDFDTAFKQRLQRHRETVHSTERRFMCTFCGKAFKTQETLRLHVKIHEGREPLQCSKCSYQTVVEFSLRKHVSRMHSARRTLQDLPVTYPSGRKKSWYPCTKCAYITCSKPSLARHMKKRHPKISGLVPKSND